MNFNNNTKLIIVLLIILYYYVWTAAIASNNFDPNYNIHNYYNILTESFIKGNLYLPFEPTTEFLKSQDPYNPAKRQGYFPWDTAFYKGKFYLYFGITPILTLYLPYMLTTGKYLSDYLATLIFMFGSVIWATLFLKLVFYKNFKKIPQWMFLTIVSVIGFANVAPYLLRRLATYQVAISCGTFCLLGAIYLLHYAVLGSNLKSPKLIVLGSLFLGLAFGARPNLIFAVLVILITMIYKISKDYFTNNSNKVHYCLALILPFSMFLLFLGLYNYLRFNNPFEFGLRYTLTLQNTRLAYHFNTSNILINSYLFLFHTPIINSQFPFIHILTRIPSTITPPPDFIAEKIAGIFPSIPFLLLIFVAPIISYFSANQEAQDSIFNIKEFLCVFISGWLVLLFFICCGTVTMRYLADYATLFILSTGMIWFYYDSKLSGKSKRTLRIIATSLALISIINGLCFGIEGCEYDQKYGLMGQNLTEFKKLELFFEPIQDLISKRLKK